MNKQQIKLIATDNVLTAQNELTAASNINTLAESELALLENSNFMANLKNLDTNDTDARDELFDQLKDIHHRAMHAMAKRNLDAMQHTLDMVNLDQVIYVDQEYIFTNLKDIISPAGFHPDTKVYCVGTIAILTNDMHEKIPSTNFPMYRHKMQK